MEARDIKRYNRCDSTENMNLQMMNKNKTNPEKYNDAVYAYMYISYLVINKLDKKRDTSK